MYGVQLFGFKKELNENYLGTLDAFKEMSFDMIEPFLSISYKESKTNHWAWSIPLAKKALAYCDKIGLKYETAHIGIGASIFLTPKKKLVEGILAFNKEVGLKRFVVSGMPANSFDAKRLAKYLKYVQDNIASAGCELIYHNHDDEFRKVKGHYLMDYVLEGNTVGIELDIGWASIRSDLMDIMQTYKERIHIIHFKDVKESGRGKKRLSVKFKDFSIVGEGFVETKKVVDMLPALPSFKGFLIVDQDGFADGSMLDAVKKGLQNLKELEK